MIYSNIDALKANDSLKWDFQDLYLKSLQVFNYVGEETEEYKKNCNQLADRLDVVKSNLDFIIQQTEKLPQTVNGTSFQVEA